MDKTLNLDDNPYGEIKLHRYTNYENGGGATDDLIVDMVDCDYVDETNEEKNDLWNLKQKYLCPKFSETDILYGDYYSSKSSWLRLVVHKCDAKKRLSEGKTCATDEEIEQYFHQTLMALELKQVKPNLMQYDQVPLIKYFVDGEYTSKAVKYLAKGQEFLLRESFIELEDTLLGIIDDPEELYFLEWIKGNTF